MSRPCRRPSLLILLAFLLPAPALADPPAGFAERVERLRETLGVPGATIAIVEDGRTTFARGFGITDMDAPRPVDADTNFATGSTGKAFTVAALALLVDQGRIGWDDKVIDHMPEFRMYDPWVTREMTIRDLLVHRSGLGLGAGDLLFVPRSDLSREETMRRLRHIRPATSFRSGYAYDNVLYMVAGQLIEEVSGQTWEAYVRDHVLKAGGLP
ncbi:MAG: serine hydrolase domain-containing protein, partial [Allosphingosinicella sp.]